MITTSVRIQEELMLRIELYLNSGGSISKNKRELIEIAISRFLDIEEPVAKKIAAKMEKIRSSAHLKKKSGKL